MPSSEFLSRDCPVCGSDNSSIEVASAHRAEEMSLEELHPFWYTFAGEKVFFSYARCQQCGVLYAPSFFSNDQLSGLYSDMPANMDVGVPGALDATQLDRLQQTGIARLSTLTGITARRLRDVLQGRAIPRAATR